MTRKAHWKASFLFSGVVLGSAMFRLPCSCIFPLSILFKSNFWLCFEFSALSCYSSSCWIRSASCWYARTSMPEPPSKYAVFSWGYMRSRWCRLSRQRWCILFRLGLMVWCHHMRLLSLFLCWNTLCKGTGLPMEAEEWAESKPQHCRSSRD